MTTRKHVFYGILALVSLLGLGITQSARANLITNGGFETGDFSGWTVRGRDNDVVGSVPFIPPHSGNFQALFGVGSNSITQNVATKPGSSYVIDFWLAAKIFNQVEGAFFVSWGDLTVVSGLTPPGIYGYTDTRSPSMRRAPLRRCSSNSLIRILLAIPITSTTSA